MTSVTTTTSPSVPQTPDIADLDDETGATFLAATGQAARRSALQTFRSPQLLLMPTILAALFLLIFRYVFGGAIETGQGLDYVDYLIPGFLVQTILWTGMNTPAGIAEDAASGVFDRFRSLPIPRAAVVAGRSLADTALIAWTLLLTTLLGFAVGFRSHADLGSVLTGFGLMLVAIYVFTWVFITLGLSAGNAQAAQGMSSVLIIPLSFVSSAFVPVESMPGWMQPVAANQPVNVMINAVRSLMLGGTDAAGVGHSTGYWVVLSLVWCAGILAVFSTLAVARFARTR
jgi:ABC-2 type transport system permease protein